MYDSSVATDHFEFGGEIAWRPTPEQRDRSRLSYLAEVVLTDPAAAVLPTGIPVEVDFPALQE